MKLLKVEGGTCPGAP